jgi:pyruvate kinase
MIVRRCIEEGKPVIVATQMLESMIQNPRPTRAEVSDVANAVYDRADAVMLSGESAAGKYPVRAVKMMASVADKSEEPACGIYTRPKMGTGCQGEALVAAAQQLAETYTMDGAHISAFVVLTETGKTAQFLARLRPKYPIFALSNEKKTLDRLKLLWGTEPVFYDYAKDEETNPRAVLKSLQEQGLLHTGEKVIVLYGERWGQSGQTSVVRVQEV